MPADGEIELNAGREAVTLTVANTGDRPIQVGSHYHFFETNPALAFDRERGARHPPRHPGRHRRPLRAGPERATCGSCRSRGGRTGLRLPPGRHGQLAGASDGLFTRCRARAYADMFGPTTGDRVRLADTDLVIEVERDFTTYGEEVKFGGGKVIRDGMGQSQATRADGAVDTVITNALILDHWGIVKADIGIKDGRIAGIGKAGNPDIQPGVTIIIGPGTEVIAGEGKIVTAGGIDSHIHFICPQQIEEALMSGVTTMLGGGTGPATGTNATTCTPGPWHIERMLQAAEAFPMNLGFAGKGNAALPGGAGRADRGRRLRAQAARGLGHDAGGDRLLPRRSPTTTTSRCMIHTDTLNESGFVEDTIAAFKGRTIHAFHTEGAGGGHAPDIIKVAGLPTCCRPRPTRRGPTR